MQVSALPISTTSPTITPLSSSLWRAFAFFFYDKANLFTPELGTFFRVIYVEHDFDLVED
ncbi:hypothetical protein [Lactobacillus delbrueckii]|uniref:hypothetical protein n=1 Tax=Lactobacillus delbrueckii TaxID=1584 RepID=UPI0012D7B798|nr:hypothetical protein [Lactobacillus delbrueckii]